MTIEADIFAVLKSVMPAVSPPAANVFPDVAPLSAVPPYVVYQEVGGSPIEFIGREVPTKKVERYQVTVWSATRAEAKALALLIEAAFITASPMQASPIGGRVAAYEDGTGYRGSRQDFRITSDR